MALHSKSWYHKNLSRTNAEERLMKTEKQGAFLVRESESLNGTRVLSVLIANEVHHYKIVKSADSKVSLQTQKGVQQQFFESVEHLISYYQVLRDVREFPTPLTEPVLEEGSIVEDDKDDLDSDEDDVDGEDSVSKFFMLQMDILKAKLSDHHFQGLVDGYIENGLPRDLKKVELGATRPPYLQKILVSAAGDLYKSLELFEKRMDFLQDLFDVGENKATTLSSPQKSKSLESKGMQQNTADFEGILNLLTSCKSQMLSLERKTCKILKEYSGNSKQQASTPEETCQVIPSTRLRSLTSSRHKQGICQFFQVYKGNRKNKLCISLNIKEGKMSFLKNPEDMGDTSNTCLLTNVSQILKDKASKTSLGITVDKKMTTYLFDDFKSRELFCQMIEHMKAGSSSSSQTGLNELSVFVGSWNMANAQPPDDISSWLKGVGDGKLKDFDVDNPYDIVALGTQESGLHEKEWVTKLKETLKRIFNIEYKMIAKYSLWDIRLVVFVRPLHLSKISYLKQSVVKTGIANTLGNKGAVGISFFLGKTSFCFVNCHLSARTARVARRNQNFHDILRGLNLGQDNAFDISCQFHHLFWFGDLNYRIHNLQIEEVIKKISKNELSSLQEHDQLAMEKSRGNAFFGFEEEVAKFRPTYRYKIGCNNSYIWIKRKPGAVILTNLPSWCDRVLWKSFPEMFIANTAYGATEDICTSDHVPVFASFDVGIISQSVDPDCHPLSPQENVKIEFLDIKAKVRTSCKTKFIITFHSACLEGTASSKPNSTEDCKYETRGEKSADLLYSFPGWVEADFPELVPALSNQGYLEDQHLLIAIKGDDGHESYGECVLSLKRLIRNNTEDFVSVLTHLGDESGEIRGRAKINLPYKKCRHSVVKAVADLKSMKNSDDEVNFRTSDLGSLKNDLSLRRSIQSGNFENSSQTYELVGGIGSRNDDSPALPPKKRLSRGFSNPLLSPSSPLAETTSDIIWIAETATNQGFECDSGFGEASKELPPPPVPRRLKGMAPPSPSDASPVPKPRSFKSLTRNTPKSLEEWLARIDCSQYHQKLCDAGWDDLEYLDFDGNDLQDAGIDDSAHRELILKSAKIMNNQRNKSTS